MTALSAPFGMRPVGHLSSGVVRQHEGTIASGYGTAIYQNTPVALAADGTLVVATNGTTNRLIGSFAGCEFTDATGKRVVSAIWPAGQVATEIIAFYYRDPHIVYEIQANGSVTRANVGDLMSFANIGAGSALTGLSTAAGTLTSGTQLQVVDFNREQDNAPGDAFTKVLVIIALHQHAGSVAAI